MRRDKEKRKETENMIRKLEEKKKRRRQWKREKNLNFYVDEYLDNGRLHYDAVHCAYNSFHLHGSGFLP
jgi:hypothetical protein